MLYARDHLRFQMLTCLFACRPEAAKKNPCIDGVGATGLRVHVEGKARIGIALVSWEAFSSTDGNRTLLLI